MISDLRVRFAVHGNAVAIALALAVFGAVVVLGVRSTFATDRAAAWVDHTRQVIESLDALALGVSEATSARRGFSLTGDDVQSERYATATAALREAEAHVRELTVDNRDQQRRLDELEPLLAGYLRRLDAAIASRRAHGLEPEKEAEAIRAAASDRRGIRALLAALVAEERSLLVEREHLASSSAARSKMTEAAGASVSLALILAVVIRLRREILRREDSERIVREREKAIARLNEELELRVEARTAELRLANRELESFSYSVVHDLRAPLRGMGGFAEVLLDECADTLSADAKESLGEIKQNARHMASLIDALVAMSRVTRSEVSLTTLDLTDVARKVAARLAVAQPHEAVTVAIEASLTEEADATLAQNLIEILLDNAWKFSANSAAPRIDFGVTESDGERVFFVRDTGAGFDMDHATKLFAPFGRLHTADEFPGLGIGLATAQRIVARHGGRIWGDGKVGHGASFYFTLRRA